MTEIIVEKAQHHDFREKLNLREIMLKVYSETETLTFLESRIWEIMPDCIKRINNLD